MSGFVGIHNLDDAPVDPELLGRMTANVDVAGTGQLGIRLAGSVGLGNAPLRVSPEWAGPCTLDGDVWIVADARVDGRAELLAGMAARGELVAPSATDAELILHAYRAWGESCVEHLLGDFSFVIWDERNRRLFGARDHFGVRPFFYARVGATLVLSNSLDCVRLHPSVSDRLNDQAIGDFLLFESNQDPATTAFEDIQRLPAAHTLTWSSGRLGIRRYWTLPIDEEIRYGQPEEYVERFRELLRTAVSDRVRNFDRVVVSMSGGLDSSSIAATAQHVLSERSRPFELRAHTVVYDSLIPDRERYYSGLVAEALGIPIEYLVADGYQPYDGWDSPEAWTPEPADNPLPALGANISRGRAVGGDVVLSGQGPDALFRFPMQRHLISQCSQRRFGRVITDAGHWLRSHRDLPKLAVRQRLRRLVGKHPLSSTYPPWLNRAFEARLNLRDRWSSMENERFPSVHPVRPDAYRLVTSPHWSFFFESESANVTRVPIESNHPFFDLRIVRYVLAVPPIPWCLNKRLLRSSMNGILPDAVRLRPKTPFAGDPIRERLDQGHRPIVGKLVSAPRLDHYVDLKAYREQAFDASSAWWVFRPLNFNRWLLKLSQKQATATHETPSRVRA